MKELKSNKVAGMTAAGWMIVIAVVLFFVYIAIKLIPAYIEYSNIKSLTVSVKQLGVANTSRANIIDKFKMKLGFARISFLKKDNYRVEEDKTGKYLVVDYDKKIDMFGNVFVLIEFDHKQKL